MTTPKWSCFVLILGFGGASCHTRPPAVAPSTALTPAPATVPARPPLPPTPPPRPAAPLPAPTALSEEEQFRRKSLAELNADHPLADAFFEYDEYTLSDGARQALQKDAAWLSKWTQTTITLEGYCDERGTPEYNLALGERRASAAKQYLESLGVSPNRIRTVSRGEEAPFCREDSEACWSQNRRGHFVFTAK